MNIWKVGSYNNINNQDHPRVKKNLYLKLSAVDRVYPAVQYYPEVTTTVLDTWTAKSCFRKQWQWKLIMTTLISISSLPWIFEKCVVSILTIKNIQE